MSEMQETRKPTRFRITNVIIAVAIVAVMIISGFISIASITASATPIADEPQSQNPDFYDTFTNYYTDKTGSGGLYLSDPNSKLALIQGTTYPNSVTLTRKGTTSDLLSPMQRYEYISNQWVISSNVLIQSDYLDYPMRNQTYWYNYNGYPIPILTTDYYENGANVTLMKFVWNETAYQVVRMNDQPGSILDDNYTITTCDSLTDWTNVTAGGGNNSFSISSSPKMEGTGSFKVVYNHTTPSSNTVIEKTFATTWVKGDRMYFKFWLYNADATVASAAPYFGLKIYDSVSANRNEWGLGKVDWSDGWKQVVVWWDQFSKTGLGATNIKYFDFFLNSNAAIAGTGQHTVYIDNCYADNGYTFVSEAMSKIGNNITGVHGYASAFYDTVLAYRSGGPYVGMTTSIDDNIGWSTNQHSKFVTYNVSATQQPCSGVTNSVEHFWDEGTTTDTEAWLYLSYGPFTTDRSVAFIAAVEDSESGLYAHLNASRDWQTALTQCKNYWYAKLSGLNLVSSNNLIQERIQTSVMQILCHYYEPTGYVDEGKDYSYMYPRSLTGIAIGLALYDPSDAKKMVEFFNGKAWYNHYLANGSSAELTNVQKTDYLASYLYAATRIYQLSPSSSYASNISIQVESAITWALAHLTEDYKHIICPNEINETFDPSGGSYHEHDYYHGLSAGTYGFVNNDLTKYEAYVDVFWCAAMRSASYFYSELGMLANATLCSSIADALENGIADYRQPTGELGPFIYANGTLFTGLSITTAMIYSAWLLNDQVSAAWLDAHVSTFNDITDLDIVSRFCPTTKTPYFAWDDWYIYALWSAFERAHKYGWSITDLESLLNNTGHLGTMPEGAFVSSSGDIQMPNASERNMPWSMGAFLDLVGRYLNGVDVNGNTVVINAPAVVADNRIIAGIPFTVTPASTSFGAFSVSSVGSVNIEINLSTPLRWTAYSETSAVSTFTLSGLDSGRMYRLYIDGTRDLLLTASGSGVISFTYSGPWSEHQFEIVGTSITGQVSGLVNLVFIMFAVGIVVGVIAEGTNSLRKMQMRTTEQMMKTLLNMVIYIIIGMASLGIMYSIVA